MQLFPYQIEGAKFLAAKGRALLADEPGLGKSAQAIAACDAVAADYVAVICPASVRENWHREFKRFGSRPGVQLDVRSYDAVARGDLAGAPRFDVLILDEAHYLKNHKAKRTKAIFGPKCDGVGGLVERAKHVFLLTGTPTPNHAAELWPMLRAVAPAAITPKDRPLTYWNFVNRYCKTRDNGFGIQIVGNKNADALREAIAPYVLRRKKEEVLADLPPIRFDELTLSGELKLPPEVLDEAWALEANLENFGVEALAKAAPHVAQLRRLTGLAKVEPVADWIAEQLDGGLKKLVVFAHHRDVVDQIAIALTRFQPVTLTGGTLPELRQHVVDEFQRNKLCRIFVGQIQAAGTGITLTAASDLLFVESSWVPAENEQAAMRIHRIGQRNACLVRFATLAGSIDERIQRAVMRKTQDIAKLFS